MANHSGESCLYKEFIMTSRNGTHEISKRFKMIHVHHALQLLAIAFIRCSRPEMFHEKAVLKKLTKNS